MSPASSNGTRVDDPRPIVRREDVEFHEIDGEGILFDPTTGNTHRLNATALAIWRLCDGRSDRAHIAAAMEDQYDVEGEDVAEHVDLVLRVLNERGLLLDLSNKAEIGRP